MNLNNIKKILSSNEIKPDQVNPIIDSLSLQDLTSLAEEEKDFLKNMLHQMLIMVQDSNSGANLSNPQKAEELLAALK